MAKKPSASGNGEVRGMKRYGRPTFIAGALLASCAILNLGLDGAKLLYKEHNAIAHTLNSVVGRTLLPEGKPNLLPNDMYFSMYYGKDHMEEFRATLRGNDELVGEIEDVTTGAKGVIHGHKRAGALVFEWASKDVNRPGFGTYVLRPYTSNSDKEAPDYAGIMTLHHCECGLTLRYDGPIEIGEVLLTAHPIPSKDLEEIFFKTGLHKPDGIVYPDDVQREMVAKAAAQK
jgi:hypothetical protein